MITVKTAALDMKIGGVLKYDDGKGGGLKYDVGGGGLQVDDGKEDDLENNNDGGGGLGAKG